MSLILNIGVGDSDTVGGGESCSAEMFDVGEGVGGPFDKIEH